MGARSRRTITITIITSLFCDLCLCQRQPTLRHLHQPVCQICHKAIGTKHTWLRSATLKCHLKVNWWAGNLNVKFLAWTIKKDNFFTIPKKLQLCHENVMVKNVTIFNKMIWQQSYNFVTKMWQGILICFCYNFVIRHFSDIATTLSWECDGWKRNKLSWLCKSSKFKLCCKIVLT